MIRLFRATVPTPVGDMMVLASDGALCALEFASKRRAVRLDGRCKRWFPPHTIEDGETRVTSLTRAWLDEYFSQRRDGSKCLAVRVAVDGGRASGRPDPLPLALYGTEFEKRVWSALLEIPAGETSTYGTIAKQLGVPGASRAVGLANGSNPIAIIVPCHRVIGSSGALTGYGGGLDRKRWLLAHERDKFGRTLFS